MHQKLPVGIDLFEDLRKQDYYYVDKTNFIRDLLQNRGAVNLFTRPRRFGKTLMMSMLQAFFEIKTDQPLPQQKPDFLEINEGFFKDLAITKEHLICEKYMNQHPVIFLTLKTVEGKTFEDALGRLAFQIANECIRLAFLAHSARVDKDYISIFKSLKAGKATTQQLAGCLRILTRMLHAHYGQKVILLLDEYDVPLDKAFDHGYYDDMIGFMRIFLGEAFKTNPALEFAVVTGCLRISKESIFTGINNLEVDTILDNHYDEYFGFTDEEVKKMLADYCLCSSHDQLRLWYNGYHFGQANVYCPWDIVNHVKKLHNDTQTKPEAYWNNTSSNALVKRFIDKADATTRKEIEQLIAGNTIDKTVLSNLTYAEIDESIDNLWSVLLLTGYLTQKPALEKLPRNTLRLCIPNEEIKEIFIEKIQKWFATTLRTDKAKEDQAKLYQAFLEGDCDTIQEILRLYLRTSISYYDGQENYYHGFLAGLLTGGPWAVESNRESGTGRSDIILYPVDDSIGVVIEIKPAKDLTMIPRMCESALAQIKNHSYQDAFLASEIKQARLFGIAFWKKSCGVTGQLVAIDHDCE